MSITHRPDCRLKLYLSKLRTADVVIVLIELRLEADHKVALGRRERVLSARSDVGDAWDAIDGLSLQECIGIGHCLQDAWARKGAIRQVQLGGQQVTCQTTDRILILGAAAVHRLEDLSRFDDAIHRVVAQSLWQILDGPWSVRAATATVFGYRTAQRGVPRT